MTMRLSVIRSSKRQLHTIVSKEIIKPSSPTPPHLKTYNLSLFDKTISSTFIPMVTFYPNTSIYNCSSHDKTYDLKNSLSQMLTKYYPFAGRHAKTSPTFVDCNDEGVEFLESSIDSSLSDFLQNSRHEELDQFFPCGRIWNKSNRILESGRVVPIAIQVNHFECGGVALAVSLSHKIADGSSLIHFLSDWAKLTSHNLVEPPPPHVLSFPNTDINFPEFVLERSNDCVTKSFIFPDSKINNLKQEITTMTKGFITNLTRVEVLSWLLYKCAVDAATKNNSSCFRPTGLGHAINIRTKMMELLPENTIGNIFITMETQTKNESDLNPERLIGEFKKQKMQIRVIKNIETAFAHHLNMASVADFQQQMEKYNNAYICSSVCRSSIYEIDFGWGKPIQATIAGNLTKNSFILMDSPNQNGIEALVCLGKQDMTVFQTDPHLLSFAN